MKYRLIIITILSICLGISSSIKAQGIIINGPEVVGSGVEYCYQGVDSCNSAVIIKTSIGVQSLVRETCFIESLVDTGSPSLMSSNLTSGTFVYAKITFLPTTIERYVLITASNQCGGADTLVVLVLPVISNVSLANDIQTVQVNYVPEPITVASVSGGDGEYMYQWQVSDDNSNWSDIPGADSSSYIPPANASPVIKYYRVVIQSHIYSYTSNAATVQTVLGPPVISPVNQWLGNQSSIQQLTATNVSGVPFTYQWYSSTDSLVWKAIKNANSATYTPQNLDQTTYFKLGASINSINVLFSNVVTVGILSPGIFEVSKKLIGFNESIGYLYATAASGSPGGYSYQWQQSTDSISWSDISSANTLNYYYESTIHSPLYIRRKVTSAGVTSYTGAVKFIAKSSSNTPDDNAATGTAVLKPIPKYNSEYNPDDINFVRTKLVKKPGVFDTTAVNALIDPFEQQTVTKYIDGLGREFQTVAAQASPNYGDLVSTVFYDQYGRSPNVYLPYVDDAGDGSFKMDVPQKQPSFYDNLFQGSESYYYSQSEFEPSPLGRVLKQMAPGNSWTGNLRGTSVVERFNSYDEEVRIWVIDSVSMAIPISSTIYPAGRLRVLESKDEDENRVIEYKDLSGKVVLKKVQLVANPSKAHIGWLNTYYVYDNIGNVRFVIPPKAVESISAGWVIPANISKELCFQYAYDAMNRMIIKKVPGAEPVEMVYDNRDRLVFSRDGNLKAKNQWMLTFYDGHNRPVETALYNSTANRAGLQNSMNTIAGTTTGLISYDTPVPENLEVAAHDGRTEYKASEMIVFNPGFDAGGNFETILGPGVSYSTNVTVTNPLPNINTANVYPLTYTFYDNYDYGSGGEGKHPFVASYFNKLPQVEEQFPEPADEASSLTTGLVTGTRVRVLETGDWTTVSTYYDEKGRVIQTASNNMSTGVDYISSLYDFSGKVLSTYLHHRNVASSLTPELKVLTTMNYDHGGRLISVNKQLNDEGTLKRLDTLTYDALGQLETKTLGNDLESLDYDYNIRGWVNGINKSYSENSAAPHFFGMELFYDQGYTNSSFNGNISGIRWRGFNDTTRRSYGFEYDNSNRLLKAEFTEQLGSTWNTGNNIDFTVPVIRYDANGNIMSLKRSGLNGTSSNIIDNLTYAYYDHSNKLKSVTDSVFNPNSTLGDFKEVTQGQVTDYDYDRNGNLRYDENKEIDSIRYNILNLPEYISITGKGTIEFVYDAAGNKLRKTVIDQSVSPTRTTVTDYISGVIYENDTMQFFTHEEGRIRADYNSGHLNGYIYDYFVKDHLGNVRMVLTEQTDTSIYLATMETENAPVETALFSNIDASRAANPSGYPAASSENKQVAKLNANKEGSKIGPSLVLKVMAGDTISIAANAFYKSVTPQEQAAANIETDIVPALLNALGGAAPQNALKGSGITSSPITADFYNNAYQRLRERDKGDNNTDRPKAYLNFVMFDEKFNLVEGNSGVKQVAASPDELQTLAEGLLVMEKSGFLYVYTSNESGQDVYFDNVTVAMQSGPVLEETHYYPFGLTMAGISAKAPGKLENKNEKFQGQPLDDDLGLNWYGFKWRNHDPQIGRFVQIDPLASEYTYNSTYAFSENQVTAHVELEGLEKWSIKNGIGELVNIYGPYANQNAAQQHFDDNLTTSGRAFTLGNGGFVESNRVTPNRVEALERGNLGDVNGVVLHRTASSSTEGTLRAFQNGRDGVNYGTHFLVGKDGEILQTASLESYTLHVGKVRNKTYPTNSNAIGIEVVGNYDYKAESWEPLTNAQITSTAFLTNSLKQTYNLTNAQVYNHEDISYKTKDEGRVVMNAISQYLAPPSQNTSSNKTPWWMQYLNR